MVGAIGRAAHGPARSGYGNAHADWRTLRHDLLRRRPRSHLPDLAGKVDAGRSKGPVPWLGLFLQRLRLVPELGDQRGDSDAVRRQRSLLRGCGSLRRARPHAVAHRPVECLIIFLYF